MLIESGSGPEPLRARAREAALTIEGADIDQLHQLARAAHKFRNRLVWRRLRQLRRSTIWVIIATVERMLVSPTRVKKSDAWFFYGLATYGRRLRAAMLYCPPARGFSDMATPLELQVLAGELLDAAELEHHLGPRGVRVR